MHFLAPLLKGSGAAWTLRVEGHEAPVATSLETAFDSASRRKGLLGRDGLAEGTALIIAPCSAVHTFAMRFPIDVIFARRDGTIVKMREAMPVGRVSGSFRAFAVIEAAAGTIARAAVRVGDRLEVRSALDRSSQ